MSVDILKRIETSVRSRQSMSVKGGTLWRRGGLLTVVVDAGGSDVEWLDEDGVRVEGTLKEFRSRALEHVEIPASVDDGGFVGRTWQIARARAITPAVRIIALRAQLDRAPDMESAVTIARWMRSLSMGDEPRFEE